MFGVGDPKAELMFVGEGPGADEDERGEPFVGRAGQLLTDIIERGMGIRAPDVYICNVVKCRPPGNRNPEPDEVAACEPFLMRQIELVRPQVIVGLGTFAVQSLLKVKTPISKLRGRLARGARYPDDADVPSRLPAAQSRRQAPGLGRYPGGDEKLGRPIPTAKPERTGHGAIRRCAAVLGSSLLMLLLGRRAFWSPSRTVPARPFVVIKIDSPINPAVADFSRNRSRRTCARSARADYSSWTRPAVC